MLYVVDNHDRGWDDYDVNPGIDTNTKLPYLMSRTPAVASVKTNRGSPDFNEAHHPYCGLLSSMHTWGLYNKPVWLHPVRGAARPEYCFDQCRRPEPADG